VDCGSCKSSRKADGLGGFLIQPRTIKFQISFYDLIYRFFFFIITHTFAYLVLPYLVYPYHR